MEENIFYNYVYLDPKKPGDYNYEEFHFDYEPFYIGKGKEDRMYIHLLETKETTRNGKKFNKIRKIRKNTGKDPIIFKIYDNIKEQMSLDLEYYLIKIIGRDDLKLGPLTNLTDGGEGISGWHHSDESRNKISDSLINNTYALGYKHTIEEIEKIRKSSTGRIFSNETRNKISKANTGKKRTDEQIERMAIAQTGKKLTDEHKDKISETLTGRKQSIETIDKRVKKIKGKKRTDKQRENISKAHVGIKMSEENIKKQKIRMTENNPMKGKRVYDIWLEKYGIEIAEKLKKDMADKKRLTRILNKNKGK